MNLDSKLDYHFSSIKKKNALRNRHRVAHRRTYRSIALDRHGGYLLRAHIFRNGAINGLIMRC